MTEYKTIKFIVDSILTKSCNCTIFYANSTTWLNQLPDTPGVYAIFADNDCLYAGMTTASIKGRLFKHNLLRALNWIKKQCNCIIRIYYFSVIRNRQLLLQIEKELLKELTPILIFGKRELNIINSTDKIPETRLILRLGEHWPTQKGSTWTLKIPEPRDNIKWKKLNGIALIHGSLIKEIHFENGKLIRTSFKNDEHFQYWLELFSFLSSCKITEIFNSSLTGTYSKNLKKERLLKVVAAKIEFQNDESDWELVKKLNYPL